MALEHGGFFGQYRLEELVGSGGLAEVWRAVETQSGRVVALKRFTGATASRASEELRANLELLAANALRGHPNVVEVYGGGPEPEPHVVMEFMDGGDVARLLRQSGPLSLERTLDVGHAVASALAAAADAGIVHGDIKPSNVLLGSNGDIKIGDFNVARVIGYSGASISGHILSFAYAAPEVWDGKSSSASDLYALGIVLYECLVGRPPFTGAYTEVFRAHIERPPDLDALPASTPAGLRDLIARLLAKDPANRPAHARNVLSRLEAIGDEASHTVAAVPGAVLPAAIGEWAIESPHPTIPWAWRTRSSRTGAAATVELFFGDGALGEELRRAVALNGPLVPFGAERLLDTNRLLLRPGEGFGRATPPGWIFWVAREEIMPAAGVALDEPALGRAVEQLRALQAAAASVRLTLDLSPANVALLSDGSVHVKRPGLPGGNPAAATTSALVALHALATPDLRPLVAGAASLDALAQAMGGVLPVAAATFDAPTVLVPGGPPPLTPDPALQRTTILPRPSPPAPVPASGSATDRRSPLAALAALLGVIALVLVSLLALFAFNGLSSPSSPTPPVFGGDATDAPSSAPTPTPPVTASPPPVAIATQTPLPSLAATLVPTVVPTAIPTGVPTVAPSAVATPGPTNPPPPPPTDTPRQIWQVAISASDNSVSNGERVAIRATANRNVGGSPWYIQVFNPDTGFIHWSCKLGSTCGGGARRENVTASYQARVSAVDGSNMQAQSERITVTWSGATTTWAVNLQVGETQASNGERVSIVATSNQAVTGTPYYIQIFNPENGFIHWSCKIGTSCGGGARRENVTVSYQARISNSAGGDIQAQSGSQTVTWQ